MQNTNDFGCSESSHNGASRITPIFATVEQMPITKQEFHEGAALHKLARNGKIRSLSYSPPFFTVNGNVLVCLKYSTRNRTPWGFTFTHDEQITLSNRAKRSRLVIGLVCGSDGVVAISYESLQRIAPLEKRARHVSCFRKHGQHYGVFGPEGELDRKVAPSAWQRMLESAEN